MEIIRSIVLLIFVQCISTRFNRIFVISFIARLMSLLLLDREYYMHMTICIISDQGLYENFPICFRNDLPQRFPSM